MKYLIIGMGEFGTQVARELVAHKQEVFIVDNSYDKIDLLKDEFVNVMRADCMQSQTLKELGVSEFEACIVTVGDNFQASLEITNKLRENHAKYIISKSYSDIQTKFLLMAGANEVVFPEKESAIKIATTLANRKLFNFVKISEDYGVYQIKVPKSWVDKTILFLNIRKKYGLNVLCIVSNDQIFVPDPSYSFKEDDSVYVFSAEEDSKKFMRVK